MGELTQAIAEKCSQTKLMERNLYTAGADMGNAAVKPTVIQIQTVCLNTCSYRMRANQHRCYYKCTGTGTGTLRCQRATLRAPTWPWFRGKAPSSWWVECMITWQQY